MCANTIVEKSEGLKQESSVLVEISRAARVLAQQKLADARQGAAHHEAAAAREREEAEVGPQGGPTRPRRACVMLTRRGTCRAPGVGGGAMWGFTLIADYSDNRIIEVDDQGRIVFVLDEIFGAWDAECLDNDNLLITEFSVSRVQEVNRKGETVWQFEVLKNPDQWVDLDGDGVLEFDPDMPPYPSYK